MDELHTRSFRLLFQAPFAADTLLSFLGARAVPGIEEMRDGAYVRSVRQPSGPAMVAMSPRSDHVMVRVSSEGSPDLDDLRDRTRRAFDLDADAATIDTALAADPTMTPLVARIPGIRVPGTFDGFELVVRAIFGQQVSVAGARTSLGRLVSAAGPPLERPRGGITHLFPTAERVAELPPEAFGMPRARAETIRRVALLVADGELDLSGEAPPEETLRRLGHLPGIGPWTLAYVSMRALRDPDAFMAGDLGVRKGFEALGLASTRPAMLARAERWRPWRAYAVMHLWHQQRDSGAGRA